MDWNENLKTYVSRPENSLSFLYNFHHDQHPGLEMKHLVAAQTPQMAVPAMDNHNYYGNHHEKKKRLTNDQLESLESSFEEEMKLDPDRKMKLAHELQLQPRQVAVWFQNRRARWKAKQLECLYDKLKLEFDAVSREKQKLQEEVLALKAMVKEQGTKKPVSTGYTDMSGEETVESTSVANRSSGKQPRVISHHQITECNYVFTGDDFTPVVMPPYWGTVLPSYPEI